MDSWNTTFLLGGPIFRGYVSFRECNYESHDFPKMPIAYQKKKLRHLTIFHEDASKQNMHMANPNDPPGPSGPSCHSATVTNHIRSQRLHQGSHIIHKGHLNSINISRGTSHSHPKKKSRLIVIIEFLDVWQPWMDPKRTARLILRLQRKNVRHDEAVMSSVCIYCELMAEISWAEKSFIPSNVLSSYIPADAGFLPLTSSTACAIFPLPLFQSAWILCTSSGSRVIPRRTVAYSS